MITKQETQPDDFNQKEEGEIDSSGHEEDLASLLSSQKLKSRSTFDKSSHTVPSNSKRIPQPSQNKNFKLSGSKSTEPPPIPPPPPIKEKQMPVVRSLDKKLQSMKQMFMTISDGDLRLKLEQVKTHRLHHLALNEKMVRASCLLKEPQHVRLGMKHDLTLVQEGSDGEISDDNQMILDLENHESKVVNHRDDGPTLIDVQRVIIDPKRIKRLDRIQSLPEEQESHAGVVLTGINKEQKVEEIVTSLGKIEEREGVTLQWRKVQRFQEDGMYCAFVEFFNVMSAQALVTSFKRHPQTYINSKGQQILAQYAYDSIREEPWVAIIIRNLHPKTLVQILQAQFKNYKRICQIHHIRDKNCAVVVMHSLEDAEEACRSKNGFKLAQNQRLKVHLHPQSWRKHKRPYKQKLLQAQDEIYLMQEKKKFESQEQQPIQSVQQAILQKFGRPPTIGRNRTSEELQERKEEAAPPIKKIQVKEALQEEDRFYQQVQEKSETNGEDSIHKGFYQDSYQEKSYSHRRDGYYKRQGSYREYQRNYQGNYREGNYREYSGSYGSRNNYQRGYRNRYFEEREPRYSEDYQQRRNFSRGYREQRPYDRKRDYGKMRENPAQAGPYFHSNH